MMQDSHHAEFGRLAQAWLDETASPEEAARLWQAVGDSPEHAREFAAMVRMDSLLGAVVANRVGEANAARLLQMATLKEPSSRSFRSLPRRLQAVAAVLVVGGLLAWLAWPEAQPAARPKAIAFQKPASKAPARVMVPAMKDAVSAAATELDKPLPDRLDTFYLTRVSLDQVPLREALGILQGQLLELNHLKTGQLEKLRVTVPADAALRRVTFHSGPIAFLKAVRAVAALGGCDVAVDEASLALVLHRETFPQISEKRNAMSLLSGALASNESVMASRVAQLAADAQSLGIAGDIREGTTQAMTRGQWEALKMLTEAHDQWRGALGAGFQIYVMEPGSEQPDRVLTEQEVEQIHSQNVPPAAVISPREITPPLGEKQMIGAGVVVEPQGEIFRLTIPMERSDTRPGETAESGYLAGLAETNANGAVLLMNPGQGGLITVRSGTLTGVQTNGTTQLVIVPKFDLP